MISPFIISFAFIHVPLSSIHGASILAFFPLPLPSHHRVFQPLIRGLLSRGHHVTYFAPYSLTDPPKENYTEILIKDYKKDGMYAMTGTTDEELSFVKEVPQSQQLFFIMSKQFGFAIGELVFRDDNFKALIASDKQFDLLLYCGSVMQEFYVALSHRFQTAVVELLAAGNFHYSYWLHGNPLDTSYIVDMSVAASDKMSFLQRLENTFSSLLIRSVWHLYYWPKFEALMNKEFRYPGWEDRPSLQEMISNTSLVLVNTHFSLNYPYPMSPNWKEVGGINILDKKPLPKDLQEFMDSAEGVIYFTLGSYISMSGTLAGDLKDAFSKAFAKVKLKVLWKWETAFPDLPPNIKISKWFPQQDILGHKNCKLFITHGGFLSMTESVYNGVPMIGIPILADQLKNVNHMDLHGYGVPLMLENLTEHSISWAINEVLTNTRYSENAKQRSQLFRDKPETALETGIYWTEYVIRHKGAHHLRPAIADMPWYQQAMIDVYFALATIILFPLYILYKCVRRCFKLLCSLGSQTKTNKQAMKKKTQ